MRKVLIVTFSSAGAGAHFAAQNLFELLKSSANDTGFEFQMLTVGTPRRGGSYALRYPPAPLTDVLQREIRIFWRRARKLVFRWLGGRRILSSAHIPTGLVREINRLKPDLILLNWLGDYTVSIEELANVEAPIVLRNADYWFFSGSEHFPLAQNRTHEIWENFLGFFLGLDDPKCRARKKRSLAPRVTATISPSTSMKEAVKTSGMFPDVDHFVIPNVIDSRSWSPIANQKARRVLGIPNRDFVVGFGAVAGFKDPRKGGSLLLEALGLIDQEWIEKCRMRVEHFGGHVQFKRMGNCIVRGHGFLPHERIATFFSALDIFVVPSRLEGFSNLAAQAASCGTAIVGFDVDGLREIVANGDSGILVDPFKPGALARAIVYLGDRPAVRARMGLRGATIVRERFSEQAVASEYLKVFGSSVAGNFDRGK